jgi:hypothetical protein
MEEWRCGYATPAVNVSRVHHLNTPPFPSRRTQQNSQSLTHLTPGYTWRTESSSERTRTPTMLFHNSFYPHTPPHFTTHTPTPPPPGLPALKNSPHGTCKAPDHRAWGVDRLSGIRRHQCNSLGGARRPRKPRNSSAQANVRGMASAKRPCTGAGPQRVHMNVEVRDVDAAALRGGGRQCAGAWISAVIIWWFRCCACGHAAGHGAPLFALGNVSRPNAGAARVAGACRRVGCFALHTRSCCHVDGDLAAVRARRISHLQSIGPSHPTRTHAQAHDEAPVCWICLDGPAADAPLVQPCRCPAMAVHARCLARWQLQSAGTRCVACARVDAVQTCTCPPSPLAVAGRGNTCRGVACGCRASCPPIARTPPPLPPSQRHPPANARMRTRAQAGEAVRFLQLRAAGLEARADAQPGGCVGTRGDERQL